MTFPKECSGDFLTVAVLTAATFLWFCFMLANPGQWSRLVDLENDFWVRKGIISQGLSDWCRRFEKGPGMKILIGAITLLGLRLVVIIWRHHL